MRQLFHRRACSLCVAAATAIAASAQLQADTRQPIDAERSTITVRVGKSGLFRALADDHEIRGAVTDGFVDEAAQVVELLIDARRLRVLDPNLSQHDRDEVQTRMVGAEVLDVDRFPDIRFRSTAAENTGQGWLVRGELTLHGVTRSVTATVARQEQRYKGSVRLKQTDFGITPITIAGGAVKVKNGVTIEFDLVTRSVRATER